MAVSVSGQPHDVVGTQLFQKRMKFRAVIRILQMAQLMQQHIVAQRFRQSHQIKVQIYVPSLDVTTVYLHMKDIPNDFEVGDTIPEGTIIGYQSNVSPSSIASHLHFEVRKGENYYAGDNTQSSSTTALTSIIPYGYMTK